MTQRTMPPCWMRIEVGLALALHVSLAWVSHRTPTRPVTTLAEKRHRTEREYVYTYNQPGNRKHKLHIIHTKTPPCLWSCYVSPSTLLVCKFTRANLLTQWLSRETFESEAKNSPRFLQLEANTDLFKYIILEHSVVLVSK